MDDWRKPTTSPVSTPASKPASAPASKPKIKRWKFAKGNGADIPTPFGLIKVREKDLENPSMIKTLQTAEAQSGRRIFGVVIVEA